VKFGAGGGQRPSFGRVAAEGTPHHVSEPSALGVARGHDPIRMSKQLPDIDEHARDDGHEACGHASDGQDECRLRKPRDFQPRAESRDRDCERQD